MLINNKTNKKVWITFNIDNPSTINSVNKIVIITNIIKVMKVTEYSDFFLIYRSSSMYVWVKYCIKFFKVLPPRNIDSQCKVYEFK